MRKRVLIIYYSQTGQTLDIVRSLTGPLAADHGIELVFEAIRPVQEFPFPWSLPEFFQTMPESVAGLGCNIAPVQAAAEQPFNLVILAWQAWFLSPSLPVQGFLRSAAGQALLQGRPVITINGCRNMWVMAMQDLTSLLRQAGARHVGNIALRDRAPNLLSIFSIARWLFHNRKEASGLIPRAGVSAQDIARCREYGESLLAALKAGDFSGLQTALIAQGAVEVLPGLVSLEQKAKRVFRFWAKFILRKGGAGSPRRLRRLKVFELYLYAGLFVLSPVTYAATRLLAWLAPGRFRAVVERYQSVGD